MIIKARSENRDAWHVWGEVSHVHCELTSIEKAIAREWALDPIIIRGEAEEILPSGEVKAADIQFFSRTEPVRLVTSCSVFLCTDTGKTIERLI